MVSHFTLPSLLLLLLLLFVNLHSIHANIVFEEGYTVTTILDGNKLNISPHSILPNYGSSALIILDSSGSSFYTLSFTKSQESVIKRFSGDGVAGYVDGDLGSAEFKNPRSFAVDFKGNVYVADRSNHAIRKISHSGVTTIAGGYSQKAGRADGPARNASFSDNFELAFIPERCALMISDHGNKLVRQINLKNEDCARDSHSVLGMTSAWALGVGVACACLLGLIAGFVVRPYILPHEGTSPLHISETWKRCLIRLEKRVQIFCFDIRSAIVSSPQYALLRRLIMLAVSQLSLMFRINVVQSRASCEKPVSFLDNDELSCSGITKSQMIANELRDLISLDGGMELSATSEILEQTDDKEESTDFSLHSHGKIDNMIYANITGFAEEAKITKMNEFLESSSGLVKRK